MYVDDMCFYTRALFETNLFSVTTAKVGLTQIRTRCLINERVFCLKGSVLNHIYLRCCLCHRTWPKTLCTLGMNLQQKPPHSVWLETKVYLQACCVLQQSVLLISDLHRQVCTHSKATAASQLVAAEGAMLPARTSAARRWGEPARNTCPPGNTYLRCISDQLRVNLY